MPSRNAFSLWWWRRPAIRKTCWIWISISKPISASTPSNRRKCSPPSASRYNIPRDENRKLRDYPTLAHVIRFVFEKRPDLAAVPAASIGADYQLRHLCPRRPQSQPKRQRTMRSRRKCWRSWPRRRAIPKTCWTWISISKQTSASTPSSKRRCSRRCEQRTTFRAMRISSCATSRPWPT